MPFINKYGRRVHICADVWLKNFNIEETHIGYSSVVEQNEDKSYTIYNYSDYIDNPDAYNINTKLTSNGNFLSLSEDAYAKYLSAGVTRASSSAERRGLLLQKMYFTNEDKEVAKETYSFQGVTSSYIIEEIELDPSELFPMGNEIVLFKVVDPVKKIAMVKKIRLQDYPLKSEHSIVGGVKSSKSYGYNDKGLVKHQTKLINNKILLKQTFQYISDYGTVTVKNDAISANILTPIISEKQYKGHYFRSIIYWSYTWQ